MKIPRKLKKKIPLGMYCYKFNGKISQKWNEEYKQFLPSYGVDLCPFYTSIKIKDVPQDSEDEIMKEMRDENEFPEETIGWCKLVKYSIDDQCKSCSVKMP